MAGEPALDKVLNGLKTTLTGAATLNGVTVDIDRADDDAYGKGDLPAININHTGTDFELHEHGMQLHRASVELDMLVETRAASPIGRRLREMEADIVAALWADRSLGGLAQDVGLVTAGGDEDIRADEGGRVLSIEIIFLTPVGDHRTVIGAAGLVP